MSSRSFSHHLALAAIAVAGLALASAPASAEHRGRSCPSPAPIVIRPDQGFSLGFGSADAAFFLRLGDRGRSQCAPAPPACGRPAWRQAHRSQRDRDCRPPVVRYRESCDRDDRYYRDRDDRYYRDREACDRDDRYDRDRDRDGYRR